jgi:DNA-binding transcriptional regulator YhcF (GntR family)
MIGYDRYEGVEACRSLAAVYGVLRLYNNLFQPSMNLASKERKGSLVTKKYDQAQTPYQRLLASAKVNEAVKESLREEYQRLDPVELLRQIEHQQNVLWRSAHRPATSLPPIS